MLKLNFGFLYNQTLENVRQNALALPSLIKTTKTLGFLRRNLAFFAPRSTKEVAYKTLVRPKL